MPGGSHGRGDLGNGDDLGVVYGVEHARDVAALVQGPNRAMRDALPAVGAVALRHRVDATAQAPESTSPHTDRACTFEHTETHRKQEMHFAGSFTKG